MSLLFNSFGKLNNRMGNSQIIITKVILAKHPNLDPGRASMLLNLGFSASLAKLKGNPRRRKGLKMQVEEATNEVLLTNKRKPISRRDLEAPRSRKAPQKEVKTGKKTVAKKTGRILPRREFLTKDFKIANTRTRTLASAGKQPLARARKWE